MRHLKMPNSTSILIDLGHNDLVAFEEIKRVRRCGYYTEVLLWPEKNWLQIWDREEVLFSKIKTLTPLNV